MKSLQERAKQAMATFVKEQSIDDEGEFVKLLKNSIPVPLKKPSRRYSLDSLSINLEDRELKDDEGDTGIANKLIFDGDDQDRLKFSYITHKEEQDFYTPDPDYQGLFHYPEFNVLLNVSIENKVEDEIAKFEYDFRFVEAGDEEQLASYIRTVIDQTMAYDRSGDIVGNIEKLARAYSNSGLGGKEAMENLIGSFSPKLLTNLFDAVNSYQPKPVNAMAQILYAHLPNSYAPVDIPAIAIDVDCSIQGSLIQYHLVTEDVDVDIAINVDTEKVDMTTNHSNIELKSKLRFHPLRDVVKDSLARQALLGEHSFTLKNNPNTMELKP